ncbi:MAG: DUF423 domain-containing protein [Cyclobacteriaceae bacterium]|nr:MAG: DUF423 domain-containing protein [Cyclobacteriaceae bacterium]
MNTKNTLITGALMGLLGVALGAFGAHALKPMLIETGRLDTFELAVRYQFYHAGALLVAGILQHLFSSTLYQWAATLFLSGILLFSGSLYVLCFTGISAVAMVTPFGGVLLMGGWLVMVIAIAKSIK